MKIRRDPRPPGFTLIEVIIAVAVFSVFCGLCWSLLSGWMGSSIVGVWRQTTNKQLSTLSASLRQNIDKASYPSCMTPESTIVAEKEEHFIKIIDNDASSELPDWDGEEWNDFRVAMAGPGKDGSHDPAEKKILEIIQGSPGKSRIPGFTNAPVKATKITYFLKNGESVRGRGQYSAVKNLWIRQETATIDSDDFDEDSTFSYGNPKQRKLVHGVNCILSGVAEDALAGGSGDASAVTSTPPIKIKILCVEPHKGRSKLSVTVTAHGQTGVKFGS